MEPQLHPLRVLCAAAVHRQINSTWVHPLLSFLLVQPPNLSDPRIQTTTLRPCSLADYICATTRADSHESSCMLPQSLAKTHYCSGQTARLLSLLPAAHSQSARHLLLTRWRDFTCEQPAWRRSAFTAASTSLTSPRPANQGIAAAAYLLLWPSQPLNSGVHAELHTANAARTHTQQQGETSTSCRALEHFRCSTACLQSVRVTHTTRGCTVPRSQRASAAGCSFWRSRGCAPCAPGSSRS